MSAIATAGLTHTLRRFACVAGLLVAGTEVRAEVRDYERQIIASVLVLEAADQGEVGMRAVLHVINNRAGGNPERAAGQVARPKAFSCLNAITVQKHPDYGPAIGRAMDDRMWPVARKLVDDYVAGKLGYDVTGGATHYCIHPPVSWRAQMQFTTKIGSHQFFRKG